jgi:ribosomal protein L12E/L44/L45/RPP1/RPP2
LGPSDLYKLTKEIGKFIQNIQTLGSDLSTTLETNMESQLQLEDLRKAQRELTDAFSFRRSINVDDTEAFATTVATPRVGKSIGDVEEVASEVAAAGAAGAATAAAGGAGAPKKKKKYRRRKVVKEEPVEEEEESSDDIPDYSGEIPDLDMNSAFPDLPADPVTSEAPSSVGSSSGSSELTPEEEAVMEQEFEKYTMTDPNPMSEWYDNTMATTAKNDNDSVSAVEETPIASPDESTAEAQSRFQQQMSGTWNDNVLANQDKLSPLASVMELLAVLEQEKNEADKQMEEEFRQRAELKEVYYKKQRSVLEKAATQIQQEAYVGANEAK